MHRVHSASMEALICSLIPLLVGWLRGGWIPALVHRVSAEDDPYEGARSPELRTKLEKMQIKYLTHCSEVDPEYARQRRLHASEYGD